ncbi:phage neck terminator protein [Aggregatibacter actinomycetemcomitans]|uniref:phage neck terminator protein n=1 Tax=Aggregatibacter actinomycetemcomitans TaxID=714 RepID=UPI001E3B28AC|nr:hypothetical protein [Aggregatibacter actinomycetemcomitans]
MDTTTISGFDIVRLRKLIQQALQLPDGVVIGGWLPENPLSAFITVDLLMSSETGIARRDFDGKRERITMSMQSTVSFSCFGTNAMPQCYKLKAILQSSAILQALKAMNVGIVSFSDVRNLTATIGADYEERGQFDAVFSHHHIVYTPLDPIKRVEQRTNHLTQQIGE